MPAFELSRESGSGDVSPEPSPHDELVEPYHIRESELLQAILDHIPQGIYFKDLRSRFVRVSRHLAAAFSLEDPAEALGKSDFDFLAESHARVAMQDEQGIIRTGVAIVDKEEKVTHANGDPLWVMTTKLPLRNHDGAVIGTFGISRDVTELKIAHESLRKANEEIKATHAQLVAAEKMNMARCLAAGLAHEIKNPLAMIRIGVDYLAGNAKNGMVEAPESVLATLREAVERADSMICRLQESVASDALLQKNEDLNALLRRALALLQHELESRGVGAVAHLDDALPFISADGEKILQVLFHTLTNALQASPPGGTVHIRTRTGTMGAGDIPWSAGNRSGLCFREGERVAVVEMEDSGPGIPTEILPRIFDPFFTTKPTNQGAGLGLTLSRKFMELHRGELRIENRPGGGVSARMLFKLDEIPMAGG